MLKRTLKLRNLSILIGSLFLFGSVGVYIGWDLFRASERIKLLIQNEAREQLKETINIEQARIGFGYVALDNLDFGLNEGVDSVAITELQIGWSNIEFLKSWFEPQQGITEVRIVQPEFFIGSLSSSDGDNIDENDLYARRDQIVKQIHEATRQIINSFQNVSHVAISDAVVYYRDASENIQRIAYEINGQLTLDEQSSAELSVTGRLFSALDDNVTIAAYVDLKKFDFIADVDISKFDLALGLPDWMLDIIQFNNGEVSCQLHVVKDSQSGNQSDYLVNGIIDVSGADYVLVNSKIPVYNAHATAHIDQGVVNIMSWNQEIAAGKVEITGNVSSIIDPEVNVNVLVYNADIDEIQSRLFNEKRYEVTGLLSGNFDVAGRMHDILEFSGYVQSDSLVHKSWVLFDINSLISMKYPGVSIESFDATYKETSISFTGYHNFTDPKQTSLSGQISGDLMSWFESLPLLEENKYFGEAGFTFLGPFESYTGEGEIFLSSTNESGTKTIEGTFLLSNEDILIQGKSADQDFDFNGWLSLDLTDYQLEFSNAMPVLQHELSLDDDYFDDIAVELNMSINGKNSNAEIHAAVLTNLSDTLFTYYGDYNNQSNEVALLESEFNISLPGENSLFVTGELSKDGPNYQLSNIQSPGLFYGSGEIIENGRIAVRGDIRILSSIDYLKEYFGHSVLEYGIVEGNVSVRGTVSEPDLKGVLTLFDGVKDSLSNMYGQIDLASSAWSELKFANISVMNDGTEILYGDGHFDFINNEKEISLHGSGVSSDIYNSLFSWNPKILQGDVTFNLNYSNDGNHNLILGSIDVPVGKLDRFDFYGLHIDLASPLEMLEDTREVSEENSKLPVGVWIQNINVSMLDSVAIKGSGFLSFTDDSESDFMLSMNGNFLSVFPAMDKFFLSSWGVGAADINITGSILNPTIAYGNLTIMNGSLAMESVIEEVEEINLVAELQPGSRYIEFKTFEGMLNGNPATIANSPVVINETDSTIVDLNPYELMEDGLNWGILTLETGENGVDVNIPDLMYDNETALMRLVGLNEDEKFYFSGGTSTIDNPYVQGKLILRDGRVTYPPLSISENTGVVKRFLSSIFWNVQLVPESNNFYVLKEPVSVFQTLSDLWGDVNVSLKMEDENEGLFFFGVVSEDIDVPFVVSGNLVSFRGEIETLLMDFNVEAFELYFNQEIPYIKGRAKTTIRDRNINSITYDKYVDVYLILVSEEQNSDGDKTGRLLDYGTWDDDGEPLYWYQLSLDQSIDQALGRFSVPASSANINKAIPDINPNVSTENRILKLMGITSDTIEETATRLAVDRMGEVMLSPILNPFNRTLKRWMNLDEFRVKTYFRRSYDDIGFLTSTPVQSSENLTLAESSFSPRYLYLSPELRVGKYISPFLYFLYEGQYARTINNNDQDIMGLNHVFGIQYRMPSSIIFEFQYDYDFFRFQDQGDAKLWFRHQIQLTDDEKN